MDGEEGVEEQILQSTEVFDTATETWSPGPDLPTPLAFATAVSTPYATFIVGGQSEGDNVFSVSNCISI